MISYIVVIRPTWRSTFYFSAALAVFYLVLGWISIEDDSPPPGTDQRIDWLGAFLVTAGLFLIVFVLSDGGVVGWGTPCSSPILPCFDNLPLTQSYRHYRPTLRGCTLPWAVRGLGILPRRETG